MQVELCLRPNTAPRPCAHLQTRVEASRHYATVYLERRQYFVRANEWPCRWLDGGGCALGISGNKGQTGSVDCRGCVHTLPRITGRTRHRGINIHFGEMRAPDDVRWCMLRPLYPSPCKAIPIVLALHAGEQAYVLPPLIKARVRSDYQCAN